MQGQKWLIQNWWFFLSLPEQKNCGFSLELLHRDGKTWVETTQNRRWWFYYLFVIKPGPGSLGGPIPTPRFVMKINIFFPTENSFAHCIHQKCKQQGGKLFLMRNNRSRMGFKTCKESTVSPQNKNNFSQAADSGILRSFALPSWRTWTLQPWRKHLLHSQKCRRCTQFPTTPKKIQWTHKSNNTSVILHPGGGKEKIFFGGSSSHEQQMEQELETSSAFPACFPLEKGIFVHTTPWRTGTGAAPSSEAPRIPGKSRNAGLEAGAAADGR